MASTLKLIIEKGPRCGETLEFNSPSTVRLGRLVRGNNLTIKDAGISSKHLSIEFDTGSGNWVVTDLDSSNGTILNSSQLKPLSPFVIHHGDVVKLGELTLIRVSIGVEICSGNLGEEVRVNVLQGNGNDEGEEEEKNVAVSTRQTRNSRREVEEEFLSLDVLPLRKSRRVNNVVVEEGSKTLGGRGRRKNKTDVKESDGINNDAITQRGVVEEIVVSSDVVEDVMVKEADDGHVEDEGVVVKSKRTRGGRGRGRGRKKKADVKEVEIAMDDAPPLQNVVEEKVVSGAVSGVGVAFPEQTEGFQCGSEEGRCEEPVCASIEQNEAEDEMNDSFLGERCEEPICTSNQRPNEVQDDLNGGFLGGNICEQVDGDLYPREQSCAEPMYDIVQLDKPGDAVNADVSVEVEASLKPFNEIDQEIKLKDKANIQVLEVSENVGGSSCAPREEIMVGASEAEKQTQDKLESDLASEDRVMEESVSGEILEETGSGDHGRIPDREPVSAPDLEKMTLGEWFDYLEVYLPKQIYDVTDEIVDGMRKRAKQFDEFMLEQQQQKEKGKLPMAT